MEFTLNKDNTVAKCSSRGGELVSFVHNGTEYVWYGRPEHWSGQAPCLFPVVCRAKDDIVIIDGKAYPMPKHCIARKVEYTPAEVCADKVVLMYKSNEETKKSYPFDFTLKITHSVTSDSFTTMYTVINDSNKEMPFCIGSHPGFNCPLFEGESFEDYSFYFDDAAGAVEVNVELDGGYMCPQNKPLGLIKNNEMPLRYSDYDNDAVIIEGLPKKSLRCINRNTGKGFRFDFPKYDALGIWTPIKMNSPFICLEPWNGLPASTEETADIKNKKYIKTLLPGERYSSHYTMTVIG